MFSLLDILIECCIFVYYYASCSLGEPEGWVTIQMTQYTAMLHTKVFLLSNVFLFRSPFCVSRVQN